MTPAVIGRFFYAYPAGRWPTTAPLARDPRDGEPAVGKIQ